MISHACAYALPTSTRPDDVPKPDMVIHHDKPVPEVRDPLEKRHPSSLYVNPNPPKPDQHDEYAVGSHPMPHVTPRPLYDPYNQADDGGYPLH